MSRERKKLSFKEKLAYGMGDCGANVYVALAGTFLTGYYTDTVGLAVAAVGTMMLLARIFDGVTDLLMGAIVDKTKSKYGKARPWVLWTAPLMALGLILLFAIPESMYGSKTALVYAYISYIFLNCIVYTANNLPYNALLSRMTLDVQDRTATASMRFVMTQITALVINAVTANLIGVIGWLGCAVVFAVIEFIMLIWCFFGCKEHIGENEEGVVKVEEVPFSVAFPALLKNKYFYLQALLFLVLYIGVVAGGSSTYYFCNVVLGNLGVITLTSIATTIPAMIMNFINPRLVMKFGKRKVMIFASAISIIGSIVVGAWILAFGGYDGTAVVQSASAVAAIKFAYGYLGAIISGICLLIILAMNIDKYIGEIQRDLEAKRN